MGYRREMEKGGEVGIQAQTRNRLAPPRHSARLGLDWTVNQFGWVASVG